MPKSTLIMCALWVFGNLESKVFCFIPCRVTVGGLISVVAGAVGTSGSTGNGGKLLCW